MRLTTALTCAALAFCAGSAVAMDDMKKGTTSKDSTMTKGTMTMQECKDHMAMKNGMKKDAAKNDDAMMKKDAMCADMMSKSGSSAGSSGGTTKK